ncbi:hypothetical protein ALC53_00420 [Atta colombica]|uniref:Uncharacterized protein n=1 Tax=Atta colombica TaxID=520822 RepID=A0A195BWC1_9HYME|nr:hypothetical protein ALC53_00420 [Atta colombica]
MTLGRNEVPRQSVAHLFASTSFVAFTSVVGIRRPRANYTGDIVESTNDLELMSVSDDEEEKQISARDGNQDIDDENNNIIYSPLYVANFLENEFFEDTEEKTNQILEKTNYILDSLNTSDIFSFPTELVIYGVPRLKKIDVECQLIKPKRTYVTRSRKKPESKKIVSDMYGVRTISYNLPEPDEVCAAMGVKISMLSDSEASILPSRRTKMMRLLESEWRDIEKNLHQPLLSDSSSSSSSRSDTTSSNSSSSSSSNQNNNFSSSSSFCSCSSCDRNA